jgi:hypothetical protein
MKMKNLAQNYRSLWRELNRRPVECIFVLALSQKLVLTSENQVSLKKTFGKNKKKGAEMDLNSGLDVAPKRQTPPLPRIETIETKLSIP